jgi:hypothetical protein
VYGNEWLDAESHCYIAVRKNSLFQEGMDDFLHEIDGSFERSAHN